MRAYEKDLRAMLADLATAHAVELWQIGRAKGSHLKFGMKRNGAFRILVVASSGAPGALNCVRREFLKQVDMMK